MKGLADSMYKFGNGAYALGMVRSNPNLELLAAQIQVLLSPTVTDAITKGTPIIQGLQTTLSSFATSTRGLADSLGAANPQLMQLLGTMQVFSAISAGIDVTSMALINMASALSEVAKIDTTNLSKVPWEKMAGFSKQNGNFVLAQSANNNFTIAQDSAKNIEKLTADTKANVQISKNLQALMAVLAENRDAAFSLNIDGRAVTSMIQKRQDDRKGGIPPNNGNGGLSDIRLKENIKLIGVSKLGINIYTFEYIEEVGMEGTYQGVMAQELIGTEFESALIFDGEYYAVDYSKLDV
jgi:hypothetical protein